MASREAHPAGAARPQITAQALRLPAWALVLAAGLIVTALAAIIAGNAARGEREAAVASAATAILARETEWLQAGLERELAAAADLTTELVALQVPISRATVTDGSVESAMRARLRDRLARPMRAFLANARGEIIVALAAETASIGVLDETAAPEGLGALAQATAGARRVRGLIRVGPDVQLAVVAPLTAAPHRLVVGVTLPLDDALLVRIAYRAGDGVPRGVGAWADFGAGRWVSATGQAREFRTLAGSFLSPAALRGTQRFAAGDIAGAATAVALDHGRLLLAVWAPAAALVPAVAASGGSAPVWIAGTLITVLGALFAAALARALRRTLEGHAGRWRWLAESRLAERAVAAWREATASERQRWANYLECLLGRLSELGDGGHSARVAALAEACARRAPDAIGRERAVRLRALRAAALLHDMPRYLVDDTLLTRTTRLSAPCDRLELVRLRVEIVGRDLEIEALHGRYEYLCRTLRELGVSPDKGSVHTRAETVLRERKQQLRRWLETVERLNRADARPTDDEADFVREFGQIPWVGVDGTRYALLDPDEIEHLLTPAGTLTQAERRIVQNRLASLPELVACETPPDPLAPLAGFVQPGSPVWQLIEVLHALDEMCLPRRPGREPMTLAEAAALLRRRAAEHDWPEGLVEAVLACPEVQATYRELRARPSDPNREESHHERSAVCS